jgi:NAD(P)-dependent dehydrogenase (short-subunit alcohol dehydrogenase family)
MTTAPTDDRTERGPALLGQTVVVIGGSAGIGLETARLAHAEGAEVVLVARDRERLDRAAREVGARETAAFDADDPDRVERLFAELSGPVDHVLHTAGGPYYAPLDDLDFPLALRSLDHELLDKLRLARAARGHMPPGGSLVFLGGTGGRHPAVGLALAGAVTAALPALVANLAVELAPLRVNLVAPGFVDTPLSARILGAGLDARRDGLRATLPIGRVVGPEDVAALVVHLMANTALTGATYDVDGGQQLVPAAWG